MNISQATMYWNKKACVTLSCSSFPEEMLTILVAGNVRTYKFAEKKHLINAGPCDEGGSEC